MTRPIGEIGKSAIKYRNTIIKDLKDLHKETNRNEKINIIKNYTEWTIADASLFIVKTLIEEFFLPEIKNKIQTKRIVYR